MASKVFGKNDGETRLSYLLGFPSVQDWLEGIRDGHASNATKNAYAWGFYQFCNDTEITPEELLRERISESVNADPKVRFHAEDR